jgi:outer membrane lipoprotein-sorting protein
MHQYRLIAPFVIVLLLALSTKAKDKTIVHSVSKKDILLLRNVDQKYQKKHGIHQKLKKTIKMEMLGATRSSEGEMWLNNGQMRLEIHKPDSSKIIADKKYLWIESAAPEDFEDSKVQVVRASLTSKEAKAQGLIQLLTQGGVLKYFRVSGIQKKDNKTTYFLQPDKPAVEFKRAQIVIDTKARTITRLRYWDQVDNETTYDFINTEFNQKLDKNLFTYTPPKSAEVIVY